MTFKISLRNDISFLADEENTILESAKKSSVVLDYSCLAGRCQSCKARVVEGFSENQFDDFVLSEKEREEGFILTCSALPKSNMKLDIEDLQSFDIQKSRIIPGKIDILEKVSSDVIRLVLRLPPNSNFKFIPGQYVNLIKGDIRRSYSISGFSKNNFKIEFFIKQYPKGKMSSYLFNSSNKDDLLRIEGPLGTFFYREKPEIKNVVFLATGTGIAPIKCILEDHSRRWDSDTKIFLIWGARKTDDFFWKPVADSNVQFIPTLSQQDKSWDGEFGYVQDVAIRRIPDFSETLVFACGSNDMIRDSKKSMMERGLPENSFFSDAFVVSN